MSIVYTEPQISTEGLYEQLQEDIKQVFYKYTGNIISPLLLDLITQEVIQKSAFLDGFYFEGDILSAMARVSYK